MEHRPVDRTPVFPVVTAYLGSRALGRPYLDTVLDPLLQFDGLKTMVERFGFDGVEVGVGPTAGWEEWQKVVEIDGVRYLANAEGRPHARLQDDDAPVALSSAPPIKEKRDLDKMAVTPAEDYERSGCLEPVRALVESIGDRVFLAGCAAGQTMNTLAGWRGGEQAMLDLREDPGFVTEVMERATAISIELGKALISAGVHGIYTGDAWASASIISPRDYEKFCQPFHAKAARAFHELGVKVYLHICGNCKPILEMMADTGVDAIEPLDMMTAQDLGDAKKRVGDRVCFKGGVSTLTLLTGTPDEVYRVSREAIEACGPTGYILGSGDDIPRDTPFANIDAMVRAAIDAA
jgi:MtaA/CmuA family methyltransferase